MTTSLAPERLPRVPRPPDDPTWYRLDAVTGWRAAAPFDDVEEESCTRALTLARSAASRRRFDEPSGSLGGLVLPATAALDDEGTLWLLDRSSGGGRLLKLDRCACGFSAAPCTRRFDDARAIAIDGATLYVAEAGDAGGGRVTLWTLPELAPRAAWSIRHTGQPWRPVALTPDGRGGLWVADSANAMLHRLDPLGRRRASVTGMGGVHWIAVDRDGCIYVVLDGEPDVRVLRPDGTEMQRVSDPEVLRARFRSLPIEVRADGRMNLGPLCVPPRDAAWFDLAGAPASAPDDAAIPGWETAGEYIAGPLDSRLHRCQWHRIVLRAAVPDDTRLEVATWCAESPPSAADVVALPESAWATRLSVAPRARGEWDGLVRSAPGRFLWLRVRFSGNGFATPRLESARVEYPRVSLRRYLPAVWSEDPNAADFTDRFLAVFDTGFREVERRLDGQAALFDPRSTPTALLPWLGSWIGAALGRQWPERVRREFIARAARFFARLGTREGLREQLLFFLGMERPKRARQGVVECAPKTRCEPRVGPCEVPIPECDAWEPPVLILELYQLRRWLFVGTGRLGSDAVLWGQRIVNRSQLLGGAGGSGAQVGVTQLVSTPDPLRDPFDVYAHRFTVFVPAARAPTADRRLALERVIGAAAPAHTKWHVEYVEPRFRIGIQSAIGLDAVIGRRPRPFALADPADAGSVAAPLGTGTVLGGVRKGASRARIGSTARL